MFIVYGHKFKFDRLGSVPAKCPDCQHSPTFLEKAAKKATGYWIPLFNMSSGYTLGCPVCDKHFHADEATGVRLHASLAGG